MPTALRFRGARLPLTEVAECGLACLAMIASYLGFRTDLATMRGRFSVSLNGTSLMNLPAPARPPQRPLRTPLAVQPQPCRAALARLLFKECIMSKFHSIIQSIFPARNIDLDKPAVPRPFVLSPIRRAHSAWLYLWPFQSRKNLVTMLCILSAGSLVETLVVLTCLDPGALPWVLIGGLIGGMYFGPYRALPAQITVTTRSEARHLVEDVKQLVLRLGYEVGAPTGEAGHVHYRHKWHSKPGIWAAWDEQNIDLRCHDHQIELHGPVNAIEWLHATLYNRVLKQLLEG